MQSDNKTTQYYKNQLIMNKLAFLRRFTFAVVLLLSGVILRGQVDLGDCTITINDNVAYQYKGTPIKSITFVVNNGSTPVSDGYDVSYKDSEGDDVNWSTGITAGKYTLTITGNDALHTGTNSKNFYVLNASGSNYTIASEADWNLLANSCNDGYSYSNKTIKLTSDIVVGAKEGGAVTRSGLMVGSEDFPFAGTFDGYKSGSVKFHRLTFYYNEDGEDGVPVAPFQYTYNATIKNLKVDGEIHKHEYGSSGLIGHNTGISTKVKDVLVEVFIDSYFDEGEWIWTYRSGGFAVDGSGVNFEYCVYRGKLLTTEDDRNGGFCGLGSEKTYFKNCLFDPDPDSDLNGVIFANGGADFNSGGMDQIIGKVDNCYYTFDPNNYFSLNGYAQGTFAYRNVGAIEDETIGHKYTINTNNIGSYDVYVPVTVKLAEDIYFYNNGNAITIDYTATYDGETVVKDTDFTTRITDSNGDPVAEVKDAGDYTLTITNTKANYYGYTTKTLTVVPAAASWTNLQTLINNAAANDSIVLEYDYVARNTDIKPITINKDLKINLAEHRIDRHLTEKTDNGQVIKIESGKTVKIYNGTITGGYNLETSGNVDGGGILNKGYLTLNNVTVKNNKCKKVNESSTAATARGGGIYSASGSKLYIYGCTIRENEAQGGGGGIFANSANTFIIDKDASDNKSYIKSNTSKDKGGGIRVNNCTTATIKNCEINSNVLTNSSSASVANGGGIHNDDGTLTLENCIINNNIASKFGGGIYVLKGRVSAKDCTINHNQSYDADKLFNSRGGGVYIYSGTFEMDGGTIYDNSSNLAYGGGVFVNNNTTFKVKGDVQIYGNWRFYDDEHYETTNVYLTGKTNNDYITINGYITYSRIGVAKNGREGVFTKNLGEYYGDETNFTSDDSAYEITVIDGEAWFEKPDPWEPEPDPSSGKYIINNTVIIDKVYDGIDTIALVDNGKIVIVDGGYLETTIENSDVNKVIIYGGQLVPSNSGVMATMKKDISKAYELANKNWYLISSGIDNPKLVENTNLLRMADEFPEYDLYRFNESAEKQWENYRSTDPVHTNFSVNQSGTSFLENGRGYLYRNTNNYTINIRGTLNTSDVSYTLSYTDTEGNLFKGINIIGNPYSHNITKGNSGANIINGTLLESNCYILDTLGAFILASDDTLVIPPLTGILVQAKKSGSLTISSTVGSKDSRGMASNDNIGFSINNNQYKDVACVEFKEGHGLNKIEHQNKKVPMLYIHHNGEDFASVDMSANTKTFGLNFEAKTTGVYTLKVQPKGSYSYLHVYDRLTGEDIDMLDGGEYEFVGSVEDAPDRFIVRLSNNNADADEHGIFAYQSGDDIIVSGEGELQMFDIAGRLVMKACVNDVTAVRKPSHSGVYILRVVGEDVKTQKIIVN